MKNLVVNDRFVREEGDESLRHCAELILKATLRVWLQIIISDDNNGYH